MLPRYDIKCMVCGWHGEVQHGIRDAHRCPICKSYDTIQVFANKGVRHTWKDGEKPD